MDCLTASPTPAVGCRGGTDDQVILVPDEDGRGQLILDPSTIGDEIVEHQELRLVEDGAWRLMEAGDLFRRVAELKGQWCQVELPADGGLLVFVGITQNDDVGRRQRAVVWLEPVCGGMVTLKHCFTSHFSTYNIIIFDDIRPG